MKRAFLRWLKRTAILMVAVAAVAFVGTYWFRDEIAAINSEAREFAQQRDSQDCLDRAMAELSACEGLSCQMSRYVFARECLRVAAPSPELCALVPDSPVEAGLWSRDACPSPDVDASICSRVMREVAKSCLR